MNLEKVKKGGIFSRVYLLMMLLSIIAGALVLGMGIVEQTRLMEDALVQENYLLAQVASRSIEAGYIAHQWPFETLKQISESRNVLFWWVVNPDGDIYLADDAKMWRKRIDGPSIGTKEVVIKDCIFSETNEKIKLIIHPLNIGGADRGQWALYLGVSLKPITAARNEMIAKSLGFFVIIIILATLLSFYLAGNVTRPLRQLTEGATAISKGNFDHRIELNTGDEIEEVANSFNKMTDRLVAAIADLEKRTGELADSRAALLDMLKDLDKSKEELQIAYNELKELDRMKDEFLSIVSHELRTPITLIQGSLDLLIEGGVEYNKEKLLDIGRKNAIRLGKMVNDLLDFTKLKASAGKLDLVAVDANKIINDLVVEFNSLAVENGIIIEKRLEDNLILVADVDSIMRVFTNLIDNAIKFNINGGKVIISARRGKNNIKFCIEDTGIGISEDKIPRLFTRFYQADSGTTRKYPGTGLGLSIVKEIIKSHGGKIRVESEVGRGTKFYFILPASQPEQLERVIE